MICKINLSFEDGILSPQGIKGDAPGGSYYAHTNKGQPFGPGFNYLIPDSLINKNIRVIIECKARITSIGSGKDIVVSLQPDQNTVKRWSPIDVEEHVTDFNTWASFKDSTEIPAYMNSSKAEIRVFGYNTNTRSDMDYDDLLITLKKIEYE